VSVLSQGAVIAAFVAAVAAIAGWFVAHHLQVRRIDDERRAKAELAFLERQIEELYGPLSSLLWEGRRNFEDLCLSLGRNYVFPEDGVLPDDELRTWLYWSESEFLPRNERIRELLKTKAHLIHGADFPPSYIEFFRHAASWATHHRRWKDEKVPYSWRSPVAWPVMFEVDIHRSFQELKARHNLLLGRVSARG
jgi:hypothetical protein